MKKTIKNIPNKPGIYKMIDEEGRVLYIGKAKDLKKRVSQYFQKRHGKSKTPKNALPDCSKKHAKQVSTKIAESVPKSNQRHVGKSFEILLVNPRRFREISVFKNKKSGQFRTNNLACFQSISF